MCTSMGSTRGGAEGAIQAAMGPINEAKTGANFKSLPAMFKSNIRNNLIISQAMQDAIRNGNPNNMTDEWTAGLKGVKEKRKVITSYQNGRLEYTVKNKNKILLKTNDKNQVANKIAQFYNEYLK